MTKYHVNDKGVVGQCRVTVQVCRFAPADNPDGNHYPTREEAQVVANKKLEEKHGLLSTVRKVDAVPPLKMKVYRSGVMNAPEKRGVEAECYADVDEFRPEGRQGRMDGIFASPNMTGVTRWAYANAAFTSNKDSLVREITVDANTTYVYKVRDWEKASMEWDYSRHNNFEKYEAAAKKFWDNGVTLKEWSETVDPSEAAEWELLLGPDDVGSVRPVSDKRLAEAFPPGNDDRIELLKQIFKRMRRVLKEEKESG